MPRHNALTDELSLVFPLNNDNDAGPKHDPKPFPGMASSSHCTNIELTNDSIRASSSKWATIRAWEKTEEQERTCRYIVTWTWVSDCD